MSTPGRAYQERERLSQRLRELRAQAGLTGTDAARQAGVSQSKLSKHETGMLLPSARDIEALCRVYEVDAETTDELLDTLAGLRNEIISARAALRRGAHRMQQRIAAIEKDAHHVRSFQPVLVIGLLQTPEYAQEIAASELGPTEAQKVVEAKRARRANLGTQGKTYTLIMTEGALRSHVAGPELMAAQIEAIASATYADKVHIGVIPWTTPMRVFPEHGFDAYDDDAVIVGTETATAVITNPSDIDVYLNLFNGLTELAVFGNGARGVLARIAAEYRELIA